MKIVLLLVVVFLLALTFVSAERVDAGDVDIWNDDFYLYVKYTASEDWHFDQTDLIITDSKLKVATTAPYEAVHEAATTYTYKILLANAPSDLYIVAQAKISSSEFGTHEAAWDLGMYKVRIESPLAKLKDYFGFAF